MAERVIKTYRSVAVLNYVMSRMSRSRLEVADIQAIMRVRNGLMHDLLSVSPWSGLPDTERRRFSKSIYEVTRLTSVLYACAVLLGLPFTSGWHIKILSQIRQAWEHRPCDWQTEVPELVLWCLCVGGIAARHTTHRAFFEDALLRSYHQDSHGSWLPVREGLQRFLWSDVACGDSAQTLWGSLTRDSL